METKNMKLKIVRSIIELTQKGIVLFLLQYVLLFLFYKLGLYSESLASAASILFITLIATEVIEHVRNDYELSSLKFIFASIIISLSVIFITVGLINLCNEVIDLKAPVLTSALESYQ